MVRSACASGKKVYGFYRGFEGLIHNRSIPMWPETVSGIIARGGTCLKTARSEAFKTPEGQEKAIQTPGNNCHHREDQPGHSLWLSCLSTAHVTFPSRPARQVPGDLCPKIVSSKTDICLLACKFTVSSSLSFLRVLN